MPKYNTKKHFGTFVPTRSYYASRAPKLKRAAANNLIRRWLRKRRPRVDVLRQLRIRHTAAAHAAGRCCRYIASQRR